MLSKNKNILNKLKYDAITTFLCYRHVNSLVDLVNDDLQTHLQLMVFLTVSYVAISLLQVPSCYQMMQHTLSYREKPKK